jgi:hypothetical protein
LKFFERRSTHNPEAQRGDSEPLSLSLETLIDDTDERFSVAKFLPLVSIVRKNGPSDFPLGPLIFSPHHRTFDVKLTSPDEPFCRWMEMHECPAAVQWGMSTSGADELKGYLAFARRDRRRLDGTRRRECRGTKVGDISV